MFLVVQDQSEEPVNIRPGSYGAGRMPPTMRLTCEPALPSYRCQGVEGTDSCPALLRGANSFPAFVRNTFQGVNKDLTSKKG